MKTALNGHTTPLILSAKNVEVKFNLRGKTLTAVRGASLDLYKGETLAIVGESGCGKSVFTKSFIGMLDKNGYISGGSITYDGEDMAKYTAEQEWLKVRGKKIAMVFQDPMTGTAATMSIEENMAIAQRRGKSRGLGWGVREKDRECFREALKELNIGLENRLKVDTQYLSGGQRQALTLVMAALVKPKLLLLDEHTAALDPKTSEMVMELTQKIVESHDLTTLMITHDMNHAIEYGNRLIMLYQGKIVVDVKGEEKKNLTVEDLMRLFQQNSGETLVSDELVLG